jgi:hypothetical protein
LTGRNPVSWIELAEIWSSTSRKHDRALVGGMTPL